MDYTNAKKYIHEIPFKDEMLYKTNDIDFLKISPIISTPSPTLNLVMSTLLSKSDFEVNYWKQVLPRIAPSFAITTDNSRSTKADWKKLKSIDDENGTEWDEFDIGFDFI